MFRGSCERETRVFSITARPGEICDINISGGVCVCAVLAANRISASQAIPRRAEERVSIPGVECLIWIWWQSAGKAQFRRLLRHCACAAAPLKNAIKNFRGRCGGGRAMHPRQMRGDKRRGEIPSPRSLAIRLSGCSTSKRASENKSKRRNTASKKRKGGRNNGWEPSRCVQIKKLLHSGVEKLSNLSPALSSGRF
jgi:hypothetical protein